MTFRRALFWIHLGVGVSLGLVILSMCISGSILAFEPQFTQWSERSLATVTPPTLDAPRLDVDQLLKQFSEQVPDAHPSAITLKSGVASTVMVSLGRKGVVFLNPYTGLVLGHGSPVRERLHAVEEWHRWLGNRDIGQPITGAAAIAFLLLTLSGITLWWPRFIFSPRKYSHAQVWSWHNAVGFWLSPVALVITVTGIIMAFGLLGKPPAKDGARHEEPATADALFQAAQKKTPGWTAITLRFPQRGGQTIAVMTQPQPRRGVRAWITPLHTGRAWGLPGQFLNFIFAIAGLLQILTGFILVYRRFRRKQS